MGGKKPIHIMLEITPTGIHTSFYFAGATVGDLCNLNSELDIMKQELLSRIKDAPKDYEVQDFGDDEPPEEGES